MMPVADGPVLYKFSTNDFPMEERSRDSTRAHERDLFPARLAPLNDATVCVEFTSQILPRLRIMCGVICDLHVRGVPDPAEKDELTFIVGLSGGAVISQRGRQITMAPGAAIVTTREDGGYTVHKARTGRFVGLRVPRAAIAPFVPDIDDAVMRMIAPETGALMLLVRYVAALAHDGFATSSELSALITNQIHDLVAVTIGATRDAAAFAGARGVRAARLRTLKADIAANFGNCNLSVSSLARRHGITARYVHKLFEIEGTSFSEFVLNQRLARAHRILSDPRSSDRLISAVAFDAGFGDLSHFNHCFRRCYGVRPSDVRAQAKLMMAETVECWN